jgi:hypothetical protein
MDGASSARRLRERASIRRYEGRRDGRRAVLGSLDVRPRSSDPARPPVARIAGHELPWRSGGNAALLLIVHADSGRAIRRSVRRATAGSCVSLTGPLVVRADGQAAGVQSCVDTFERIKSSEVRRVSRPAQQRVVGAVAIAVAVLAYLRSRAEEPAPTPDDLQVALGRAGVDAQVEERTVTAGGIVGWVVTITLAAPLGAFFAAVGSEAGKDAYAAFRTWFRRQKLRTADSGAVVFKGSDGCELVAELGVPEEALDALRGLDWSSMPNGTIVWDHRTRRWRSDAR